MCFSLYQPIELKLALILRQFTEVIYRQAHGIGRPDILSRATLNGGKDSAHRFVAPHNLTERPFHNRDVESPSQTHCWRLIVEGIAWLQLVQEPHPLLRKGER